MVWRITPSFNFDANAAAYIAAVEAADGQALETATRYAINNFVIGCKQDGIWSAIKASCILAGARTLAGALVPLVGVAPTNVGPFVAGDYNRKTGLLGGSGKRLNSNRANNADPRDSKHMSVMVSSAPTFNNNRGLIGSDSTATTGVSHILVVNNNTLWAYANANTGIMQTPPGPGLWAVSRSSSTALSARYSGVSHSATAASQVPSSSDISLFNFGGYTFADARLSFYSIGESLDLALLDARVTALMNALAAAIP